MILRKKHYVILVKKITEYGAIILIPVFLSFRDKKRRKSYLNIYIDTIRSKSYFIVWLLIYVHYMSTSP